MPTPKELTPDQKQHWLDQAGYWGEVEEMAARQLEVAQRNTQDALRMLGTLAV